ncbi:MAG: tRNA glutamyl-Q(34) synthetase GluQRS [Plesiomonas sp.]|uniref:tRNA glutamyl-Q(34) synthetase GluQRS n=1 Tax=Plesiomonas sp. TaxID=2486279 RepID=UPI003F2F6169
MNTPLYIGRFAPSPSGSLHFGSLVAALGSYLQARSQHGLWKLRIEDIDPPREVAGASAQILRTLEAYHLHWDGEVLYQSNRHAAYDEMLDHLLTQHRAYYCQCTRKQIQQMGGFYNGHCRQHRCQANQSAIRLYQQQPVYQFTDTLRGQIVVPKALAEEDFILFRRDGLYAYNLAVVLDDIYQGITEVVRGADLIEPTVRQIALYRALGATVPQFFHLPLAVNTEGNKLSKQNHAPPIPPKHPVHTLAQALGFLGQRLPDNWQDARIDQLLNWAITHWQLRDIPQENSLLPQSFLYHNR